MTSDVAVEATNLQEPLNNAGGAFQSMFFASSPKVFPQIRSLFRQDMSYVSEDHVLMCGRHCDVH